MKYVYIDGGISFISKQYFFNLGQKSFTKYLDFIQKKIKERVKPGKKRMGK